MTSAPIPMSSGPAAISSALVLYDETLIPPHHKPEKTFMFGDERINIKQNWAGEGVAGVVWDAAIVLCEFLLTQKVLLRGKSVLEIGAGTGLAGICAYRFGAEAVLTDRLESIKILEDNVRLNADYSDTSTCNGDSHPGPNNCESSKSYQENGPAVANENGSIQVKVLDWSDRTNDLYAKKWDYVIGADIIYIESSFQDLLSTMRQLETDNLILSCRLRYGKDHRFIKRAREYFNVEKLLYDESRDIYIYQFSSLT